MQSTHSRSKASKGRNLLQGCIPTTTSLSGHFHYNLGIEDVDLAAKSLILACSHCQKDPPLIIPYKKTVSLPSQPSINDIDFLKKKGMLRDYPKSTTNHNAVKFFP
jgi:hypothetical protein